MSDQLANKPPAELWENEDLFCHDLPCRPRSETGRILVTGASGYVGGRLIPELLARGYQVRAMVRADSPEYQQLWPGVEVAVADALHKEHLRAALDGIDTAYYLIHSLLLGPEVFAAMDIEAAIHFREMAEEQQVKRIIYLGGLGDVRTGLSPHLQSRIRVAKELQRGSVPVTVLRAAVIIGSGSASYEIIYHLAKKLPVLLIPRWARSRCQPIGIRDVVKYLVGVLETPETAGRSFDIGGSDILTYHTMLETFAELLNKKRVFIPCPFSGTRLFSYLASLLTPVPAPITACLMEGLQNEVTCQDEAIKVYLPFVPLTYREAIVRAMDREEQDNIHTRWSGAYPPAHELALKLHELGDTPQYTTFYSLVTDKPASSLFRSICKVGGREGWFSNNWMWWLRGAIDRMLLGVGSSRGRRSQATLNTNDVIDFWRVEDLEPDERLLLRAEMKLPGKAWLEFQVHQEGSSRKLSVAPYYHTHSLLGRLYWYVFLPFHHYIFGDLIRQIEQRS